MTVRFWKVYDKPVVEACFLPTLALGGLTVAAVLLPQGSSVEALMESAAFFTTLILVVCFFGALFRPRR